MNGKYGYNCLLIIVLCCILLYYSQQDKMNIRKSKGILGNVNWMEKNTTTKSFDETVGKIDKTSNAIITKEDDFNFITVICCENPDKDGINDKNVQSIYLKQLTALLKSAALTTLKTLRFYIVTNIQLNHLQQTVNNITSTWPKVYRSRLQLNYSKIYYPPGTDSFKKMGAPCVTQRLFFADMYIGMNAAVYLDLDTIFLRAPEDIWDEFKKFDDYQLAAVGDSTYYSRTGRKIPYYGGGINPGIMLMNMTRMRQLMTSIPVKDIWSSAMINIANTYKGKVKHDMDVINVFFKLNPRLVYILPCWWSFIKTYCKPDYPCLEPMASINRGVALIHGAGGQFVMKNSQRQFMVIYEAFFKYNFENTFESFIIKLKQDLIASMSETSKFCNGNKNMTQIMTLELERQFL